ncbi:hypothetical protein XP1511_21140 [Xanthomonas perforans]|nr:hypothetical protein XP1511_21140 [Xanthomonas perforans]
MGAAPPLFAMQARRRFVLRRCAAVQMGRIHATSPQNPGPSPRGQLRARDVKRFAGQPCRVAPKSGQQT